MMRHGNPLVWWLVVAALAGTSRAETGATAFELVAGGRAAAAIVAGRDLSPVEQTALQLLVGEIERESGVALPVHRDPPDAGPLIVLGTRQSNPTLARLAAGDNLGPEGYLLESTERDGRPYLLILGGDERGVLYGVQEALGQVIANTGGRNLAVRACRVVRRPAIRVRGTYSLTCWGNAPKYDRQAWERTIDSMSAAGHNRIMFWMDGLFRSRRFPEAFLDRSYYTGATLTDDDIRTLIRRAHERGMEFLFGSGVFGWFTSQTFAQKFPEAADHTGSNLCPSHPVAQKVTLEYLTEMAEVFPEADGYMLEIRDEIRDCLCATCQKPLDAHGSKQFGQSELDLLDKLTQTVWKDHPRARFVWLIGYDNHPSDRLYYERIRRMGRDPRLEWLEVRGSWQLPGADGAPRPLKELSDRVYVWGGGYYAMKPESIQQLVQRIVREGVNGYLPAYEPGFGSACIYGERIPYPVELIPFRLTQFYYRTFTWEPQITPEGLRQRACREFLGDEAPIELADDLLYLREFMREHHVELTCIAPGLIRTKTLTEGVEQIWADSHMPDKKRQLERLAACVRSLQTLARGDGDMVRVAQMEQRIAAARPGAPARTMASLDLMQRAIDDIRGAIAGRRQDLLDAEDTLSRIDARIAEYLKVKGTAPAAGSARPTPISVTSGPITVDAPFPGLLLRLRVSHVDMQGGLSFMFYEHANASAVKGFPGPASMEKIAPDTLKLSGANDVGEFVLQMRVDGEGIGLELTARNRSKTPWPAHASVEPCISPRWPNLPAEYQGMTHFNRPVLFMERRGESWVRTQPLHDNVEKKRTSVLLADDRPALLDHMGICFSDAATRRSMEADDNWISTWWNKTYPPDPRHPARGVLVRRDDATGWVLTFGWDDWTNLKTHDTYDSLHVAPRLGPLAPGEAKTIRGRIGLFRGTLEEGIRRALPGGPAARR